MSINKSIIDVNFQIRVRASGIVLTIISLMILSLVSESRAENFQQILKYYMKEAVQNNPGLKAKEQTLLSADSRVSQARSEFMPKLELSSRYTRAGGGRAFVFDLNPFGFPLVIRENFMREREQETKFSVTQPLFVGGSYFYNYRTSQNLKQGAEYRFEGESNDLKLETAEAYINYLSALENVKVSEKSIQRAEELLRIARVKFQTQTGISADTLRARAELSNAQSKLTSAKNNASLSLRLLAMLTGAQINEVKVPEVEPQPAGQPLMNAEISQLETGVPDKRPEVLQLKRVIESTKSAEKAVRGAFLPAVVLAADYGWQGEEYNLNSDYDMWMVSGVLKWNLFSGFGDKNRLEEVKIKTRELEFMKNDLISSLQLNARAAALGLNNAYSEWESIQTSLSAAEENYRIRKVLYETGSGTILEMLDAAELLQQTSAGEIVSRYNSIYAQIKLNWALGVDLLEISLK